MAGVIVDYDLGKLNWDYTPGNFPATELRVKLGSDPASLSLAKSYPPDATNSVLLKDFTPATGQYYIQMVAANAKGEGVSGPVIPFVAGDGLPDGSLTYSIGS